MTYTISTSEPAATNSLGRAIGARLKGGEVIELVGDIGSGKTTLTQGLARGMACEDAVTSPTFTISRVYPGHNGLTLHHFDFYRMHGHDITTDELQEVLQDPKAVVIVEWAGSADVQLPARRIQISLQPGPDEDRRDITLAALSEDLYYLLEGLKE